MAATNGTRSPRRSAPKPTGPISGLRTGYRPTPSPQQEATAAERTQPRCNTRSTANRAKILHFPPSGRKPGPRPNSMHRLARFPSCRPSCMSPVMSLSQRPRNCWPRPPTEPRSWSCCQIVINRSVATGQKSPLLVAPHGTFSKTTYGQCEPALHGRPPPTVTANAKSSRGPGHQIRPGATCVSSATAPPAHLPRAEGHPPAPGVRRRHSSHESRRTRGFLTPW